MNDIKKAYLEGFTPANLAEYYSTDYFYITKCFKIMRISKQDIKIMRTNLHKILKEYNNLSSYKIPKERRLEARSRIILRRIEKHSIYLKLLSIPFLYYLV